MTAAQPEQPQAHRGRVRRKPGLARAQRAAEGAAAWRFLQRRWPLAFTISFGFVLGAELHVRHNPKLGGAIVAWLIYGVIARLLILIVDRAPGGRTRRPEPTGTSRTWTIRYAALSLLAVVALGFGVNALRSLAGLRWPEAGKGVLFVDVLFLLVLVPLLRAGRLRPVDLGLRRTPRKPAVGLVLLGVAAVSVFDSVWRAIVSLPRIEDGLAGLPHHDTSSIVLAGVGLCFSAPVVEEIFFRGFLYRSLRNRLPVLPAALIVALIFGLGHTQYPLLERPQQAAFGLIACLLYERSGSLLPGIALHVLIDASAFEFALTGTAWIVPCVFLLAGVLLLYGAPFVARRRGGPRRRLRPRTA